MSSRLTQVEIKKRLPELKFRWRISQGQLCTNFATAHFSEALWVLKEVGKVAEKMNHHPELRIYDYNKVEICTKTHTEEGITARDFTLIKKIEAILKKLQ